MTLKEYMAKLGWSRNDLARYAGINFRTAKRALEGLPIESWTARKIADAVSRGMKTKVWPGDIEGLYREKS